MKRRFFWSVFFTVFFRRQIYNDIGAISGNPPAMFMQVFRLTIFRFSFRAFFDLVTFSRFRSSFLSDVYCSHSEVKLVVNIKSVAA